MSSAHVEDATDDTVQKISIVRYGYNRPLVASEERLKPRQHLEIEMIGRLVEHQYIRLPQHHARKRQTCPLSTREHAYLLVMSLRIKSHARQHSCKLTLISIPSRQIILVHQMSVRLQILIEPGIASIGDSLFQSGNFLFHLVEMRKGLGRFFKNCPL